MPARACSRSRWASRRSCSSSRCSSSTASTRCRPPSPSAGGIAAIIVLLLASRMTGSRAGVGFGWLLQAAILATGFIEPFMVVVGLVFLALWVFCFVKGGQLDRQNAARRAALGED
ncbi:DUF4233 domain-containing protein [Curtobacterium sp. MCJR17_043]|uniref:DUF4233 domain-containing protein n=1 Tax=Curtobacterium sp. MCJR17_043 TaxID=2175660 RepID=UPI0024E039E0|nr:DUF4233 domain-containing protein [Curtobacterium sp. MCJR17_043]WIB37000.1 DUF4233 domain-containing protein [Curtobacterium sp. MCJR17_043]